MSTLSPRQTGHLLVLDDTPPDSIVTPLSPLICAPPPTLPLFSPESDIHIVLNVGGTRYETTVLSLRKYPDSLLGRMFSAENLAANGLTKQDAKGEYFIDRNGRYFECILDFYRTGQVCVPPSMHAAGIREEISFFQLPVDERQFLVPGETWGDRVGKIAMNRALENAKPVLDKIMEHLQNALNAAADRGCWRLTLDVCRTTAYVRTSGGVVKRDARLVSTSSFNTSISSSPPQISFAAAAAAEEGLHPNQVVSSLESQDIPTCAPQWHSNLIDAGVTKWLCNNDNRRLLEAHLIKEGFKFTLKRELSFFVLSIHLFDLPRILNPAPGLFPHAAPASSSGHTSPTSAHHATLGPDPNH